MLPVLVLKNQFGEESINDVLPGGTTLPGAAPVATKTVIMNNTGGSAVPTAVAVQAVSNALPSKAGVTAINALGTVTVVDNTKASIDTALATIVAQMNTILAALKVVS